MDWEDHIDRIPEPLTTKTIWENDDEHRGHSKYTGCGTGENGDYWDCYCLRDGCKPPTDLESLLKYVNNPDEVREWRQKYKFTMIVCFCWCCHGAEPVIMYGWPKDQPSFMDPSTPKYDFSDDESDEPLPKNWTARPGKHAFFVTPDDKLIYYGEIYDIDRRRIHRS